MYLSGNMNGTKCSTSIAIMLENSRYIKNNTIQSICKDDLIIDYKHSFPTEKMESLQYRMVNTWSQTRKRCSQEIIDTLYNVVCGLFIQPLNLMKGIM